MAISSVVVGSVTENSARIIAQSTGTSVEMVLATRSDFSNAVSYGPVSPDAQDVIEYNPGSLDVNTQHYYGFIEDGGPQSEITGQFRTFPAEGSVTSFQVAISSCAAGVNYPGTVGDTLASDRISNAPVFDTIRETNPLAFIHQGDLHYYDLGSGLHGISGGASLSNYRRAYEDVLKQTNQAELYRNIPFIYGWDDHDFGPNNSDGTHTGKGNAAQVFRERVPHYLLAEASGPIYHSFRIGRVLFVVSDTRYNRSPSGDPDDATKTMLGSAQKTWLQNLLTNTDAEFFVWLMPTPWMQPGQNSWGGYTTERDELRDMLISTGWMDRMCMINGDYHGLALDSGTGNEAITGCTFPLAILGSLDSIVEGGGEPNNLYDQGPTQPGPGQWGTLDIRDQGGTINVTITAYEGGDSPEVWGTLGFQTETSTPIYEGEGEPRTAVEWIGCDLVTGKIIADLPDLTVQSISRVLGQKTSAQATLPIPIAPPSQATRQKFAATTPGRTMIVAVVNNRPVWAGIVLTRKGGTGQSLDLALVSLEGYFDRRHVLNHTWRGQDDALVIAPGLVSDGNDFEGINCFIDARPSGIRRDRTYERTDWKTVYEALEELMGVTNGPEWTIDLDWTDSTQTAIAKIVRIRHRIGRSPEFLQAVFETQGESDATYTYQEDYTEGKGANWVVAYSSGEGESQPRSDVYRDENLFNAGWPRWEQVFQPSTSIKRVETLNNHAEAELQRRARGSRTWEIQARFDAYPRLGIDWNIGDDIMARLVGHRHPPQSYENLTTYDEQVRNLYNLRLYYKLDENPDTLEVINSAPTGEVGNGVASSDTMSGAPGLTSVGTSFDFNQSNFDRIDLPRGSELINGMNALTVGLWFNHDLPDENDFLIDATDGTAMNGFSIRKGSGNNLLIVFQLNTDDNLVTTPINSIDPNTTYFVVVSWSSGQEIRCWVNGVEQTLNVSRGVIDPEGRTDSGWPDMVLGRWRASSSATNHLDGRLDEVFAAGTYVSQQEVDRLYETGQGLPPSLAEEDGVTIIARCIGWDLDPQQGTVKPILWEGD